MKSLLTFKIHSLIDVITNSSSELFICDTGITVRAVKELLERMCELVNATFDHAFQEPYQLVTDDHIKDFIEVYGSWWDDIEYDYSSDIPFQEKHDKYKKAQAEWQEKEFNEKKEEYQDIIIILSRDDNSVPYELWELIENNLGATRYHLG